MELIFKWWRIVFYIFGLCGLIWGLMTGNSNLGIMIWLCLSNIILLPVIADECMYALEGEDNED